MNFWESRWSEGRIGFHEGKPNQHLVKHLGVFSGAKRVFVPLCGKAEDLAFLAAQGHEVIGVELVEAAVRAFFEEHGVTPELSPAGPFTRYRAQNITVFAGDFFASTPKLLGPLDALYDRAAVIALPAELRGPYLEHLRTLLPAGTKGLLVSVEYPQEKLGGPPFSVPEAELRARLSLELLDTVPADGPRLTPLDAIEKCFVVTI